MIDSTPEITPRVPSFEEQFSKPKSVQIFNDKVMYVDIHPQTESEKSAVPVLVAPGWGGSIAAIEGPLRELTERGRRVIAMSTPRDRGIGKELREEDRKMADLLGILQAEKIKKVDVVAHSEGAIYSSMAALIDPEKFRYLVLVNPGGMIGKDATPKLLTRFALNTMEKAVHATAHPQYMGTIGSMGAEGFKAIINNPELTYRELHEISRADIHNTLRYVHSKGVGIFIIQTTGDTVFPIGRMVNAFKIKRDPITNEPLKDRYIDGFYSMGGTHNELSLNAKPIIDLIDKVLTNMGNIKSLESVS